MFKKVAITLLLVLVVVLPAWGVYQLTRPSKDFSVQARVDVTEALGNSGDTRFARVTQPREFVFPADHGPHLEYGVEWWYFTGNLDSADGRHFGFELTLFRIGLDAEGQERESEWGTSQIYMGHFALTDVAGGEFYAFERFSRAALGLAGAELVGDQGFRVWLEDWTVEGTGSDQPVVRLKAREDSIEIDLTLVSDKPLVLQGDRGFSQKNAGFGNASYYYSITRMSTTGTVMVGGQTFRVSGSSWMDREWSTSALSDEQEGWDWFALQLSDGRDVMYYQLRLKDGGVDPFSGGVVVAEDGSTISIFASDVSISVLDRWDSQRGDSYPILWRFQVPSKGIDVEVVPYTKNQELDLSVRYWEGAVKIAGTSQGEPVTGNGYVEMTGYGTGAVDRLPE